MEMPFTSESCFVKKGTRPQRISTSSRRPVSLALRMTGWNVVGAMLKSQSGKTKVEGDFAKTVGFGDSLFI